MNRLDSVLKRVFDFLVSTGAIALFSPLLLLIAVVIKCESTGPVLYRGIRVGIGGRRFGMLKFRTMVVGAEQIGGASTADDDPRITRVGRQLRRSKLDELPQLLNVWKGDMSLVGPRPEVPQYAAMLADEERQILTVRPGITDLATLWNPDEGAALKGADDADRVYLEQIRPMKVQLQLRYVRCRSFRVDLWILWETLLTILLRRRSAAVRMMREAGRRAPA